jgi:hypothetical protein
MSETIMAIYKRVYTGEPRFLEKLARTFNHLRPRSAAVAEDYDGHARMVVLGWTDPHAAAVWTLVRSGVAPEQITVAVVNAKARELLSGAKAEGQPLNPVWLGEVVSSPTGGATALTPPELAEGAAGTAPAVREEASDEDPDTPIGGDLPPEPIPAPPVEVEGLPSLTAGTPSSATLPPPDHYRITIQVEPEAWKLVVMLGVAWDMAPPEAVERLLTERLEFYKNPVNLAWLTGASDN